MKANWNGITAQVKDGETPREAIERKVKRVHGTRHALREDSFNDGGGALYRLCEHRTDGVHIYGAAHRIKTT